MRFAEFQKNFFFSELRSDERVAFFLQIVNLQRFTVEMVFLSFQHSIKKERHTSSGFPEQRG
jgi:hypothetical protein